MSPAQKSAAPEAKSKDVHSSGAGCGDLHGILAAFYEQGRKGRERAIERFTRCADADVYPALERALRDGENAAMRNAAMETYVALGGRSLPPLLALLRDSDAEIRQFVAVVLGELRDPGAVPGLIAALSDADLNVKHGAAEALGKIRDPRAVEPLIEALQADMWLQFPAAAALGEIGDARAVSSLVSLLDTPGANIPAIQSLGKLGDLSVLKHLVVFLQEDEQSLREWALEAIARLVSRHRDKTYSIGLLQKAVDSLVAMAGSESLKVRRSAVLLLGFFKVPAALATLIALLADRDMREEAMEAIVRIGDEKAVTGLAACSIHPDPLVRRAAVAAMSGIGTDRSMKAILPFASDAVEEVRMEAALALSRFSAAEARTALTRALSTMTGAAREAEQKALNAYAALTSSPGSPFAFDLADVIPLREFISDRLGLYYDDDRLNVLHHRLAPLAAAGGFTSLTRYYQHIVNGPGGREALFRIAAQLTNNETYFFRETEQISAVIREVLPGLLGKLADGPSKKLHILSAGCSTGEEAYTMAVMLDESGVGRDRFEILAMDIDPEALAAGRQGRYPARSFRGGEQSRLKKYFSENGDGYAVNDSIRGMVRFQQGNILESAMEEAFHLILCRNVLIYFSDAAMDRAARNFHRMLVPGGVLLLGHSESFCRVNTDLAPERLEGAVVYRKA